MALQSRTGGTTRRRIDSSHYLYIAVIVAVLAGITVGLAAPEFAVGLKPIGDAFVLLIKMMIAPIIFCTIVLGVGSIAKAATVGKVGGLALLYFMVMSTFALGIGLVVGNLIHPGEGLNIAGTSYDAGTTEAKTTSEFILGIIPTSLLSSLVDGNILQVLFVALLVGFALQKMGAKGTPILGAIRQIQALVFRILAMIMWVAPIGAFGAIAPSSATRASRAIIGLGTLMIAFYITCALFIVVVLGSLLWAVSRREHLPHDEVPRPRVPAHRLDLVERGRAAAAHREDGARGRLEAGRGHHDPHGLLVQPRRHRDLPDDGLAVHRERHGHAARRSASRSRCCCS